MPLRRFYACYYVAVGVSLPFFPPYLRGLGLSGRQIGLLLSVAPVLHLFAPLGWGWIADRTRRPDLLLRIACLGAAITMAPLVFVRTMPALLVAYVAHQFFAVPITGLADTLALDKVRRGADYGRIRVWGSLSFTATCLAVGWWIGARDVRGGDAFVPGLLAAGLGLTFLAALGLEGHADRERPHAREVLVLLADRRFRLLLVVAPLHWVACAPYHGFFSILLQDRGLSAAVAGQAFAFSVAGEILAFYFYARIRSWASPWRLFSLTFAASALRWWLMAATDTAWVLVALQMVHALTFGVFWGTALAWVATCIPARMRATGQAMFTAATFGIGNIAGMTGAGALYDLAGGAGPAFVAAGAFELLPLAVALTFARKLSPHQDDSHLGRAASGGR